MSDNLIKIEVVCENVFVMDVDSIEFLRYYET